MSIKISVVEKKLVETVNQYNIDEYYINESYGSIERFNQIVNGETLKNNEKPINLFKTIFFQNISYVWVGIQMLILFSKCKLNF